MSLESFITGKIKTINKEERFNLSNQEIADVHEEKCFKETAEEDFLKLSCNNPTLKTMMQTFQNKIATRMNHVM